MTPKKLKKRARKKFNKYEEIKKIWQKILNWQDIAHDKDAFSIINNININKK